MQVKRLVHVPVVLALAIGAVLAPATSVETIRSELSAWGWGGICQLYPRLPWCQA